MSNKKNKGFTLTELIIVIVIIGILAAVLIPTITGYVEKARLSNDVTDARNMTQIVNLYQIENDVELITASDIRYAVMSEDSKYTFVPRVKGYHFIYDVIDKVIKVEKESDLSIRADSVYPENKTFVEDVFTNKKLLDTAGSELADTINAYYNITCETDYLVAQAKSQALGGMLTNHFARYTPSNAIFVSDIGYYTLIDSTNVTSLDYVLFGNNIKSLTSVSIPTFLTEIPNDVIINVPVSVEVIFAGTFENVIDATFNIPNPKVKVTSNSFNSKYNQIGTSINESNNYTIDSWIVYDFTNLEYAGHGTSVDCSVGFGFNPKIKDNVTDALIGVDNWFSTIGKPDKDIANLKSSYCAAFNKDYSTQYSNKEFNYLTGVSFNQSINVGDGTNTEISKVVMILPTNALYRIEYKFVGENDYTTYVDNIVLYDSLLNINKLNGFQFGYIRIINNSTNDEICNYQFKLRDLSLTGIKAQLNLNDNWLTQ